MSKILIDLVEFETALNKTEMDAEMSGKNHAFVKGIRAAKKIALACKDTEIVQCNDCKWYDERISMCDNCGSPRERTFFCADGERR